MLDALAASERQRRELEQSSRDGASSGASVDIDALAEQAVRRDDGAVLLVGRVSVGDEQTLLATVNRLKARLGDAAIVLASELDGRVALVASVAPALVERGVKAGTIVREAAGAVGGGGGGRDTLARAGARDVARLEDALDVARSAIEASL